MICPWKELLSILPPWLRPEVDSLGKDTLQELRLRLDSPAQLVLAGQSRWLRRKITREDLLFVVNVATEYSPWNAATTAQGYLTGPGGHRIGICGDTVVREGSVCGFRDPRSLCIRVCRDFPGIAGNLMPVTESVLILGSPGWGKTTLLRDLARQLAQGESVAVVDERGELFPPGVPLGKRMDVLTGCPKAHGIELVLRSMSPNWIAVDEITAQSDCQAITEATGCGVKLLATAHASSLEDLNKRPVYRPLIQLKIFTHICVLSRDKTWHLERSYA